MEATPRIDANPVTLSPQLTDLSDGDLLAGTRRLVGASNQLLASLLAHLAEVEARGVHRTRACSSLYTYCVYELRFSEDAAFRRVSAARLVRRFPGIFDAIASGELHLTAVLMLGPHPTGDNCGEVLARAKHRTKREVGQLVRELDPVPDVPARIEPLGPAPAHGLLRLRRPTWEMFVRSFNPVRNLNPGERPRDWMDDGLAQFANDADLAGVVLVSASEVSDSASEVSAFSEPALERSEPAPERSGPSVPSRAEAIAEVKLGNKLPPAPAVGPQRYSVQFTATAEHIALVERAQALLSSSREGASLAEVHLQAMRELVAVLEKRKYGVGARPRAVRKSAANATKEREVAALTEIDAVPASQVGEGSRPVDPLERHAGRQPDVDESSRQRGRHVPADVRREVFERDAGRCGYVDSAGQRCRETRGLELHHLRAFALGGEHSTANLALRCRAHNAPAAEEDFGRELIEAKRGSMRHESFASAAPAGGEPSRK
jgi:hypothetical protein